MLLVYTFLLCGMKFQCLLKNETGFTFKLHMNDFYAEAFNFQTFNQDVNESPILKKIYYNPPNLMFQHIPMKVKVKKEVNRLHIGYTIYTLSSVDMQEIVKIGRKVIRTFEGVVYREKFKVSLFRKIIEKLFSVGQRIKTSVRIQCKG